MYYVPLFIHIYPSNAAVAQPNKESSPQRIKAAIVMATNTIKVVWVVSVLVGHTTLLISVLESMTVLSASLPSWVVVKTKSPKLDTIITPMTLYKRGS